MIDYKADKYLTENFQMKEFLVSAEHPQMVANVELLEAEILYYTQLCAFCLQLVRDLYGPVIITSGFRPKILNEVIGGHPKSLHLEGMAADFYCPNVPMQEVWEFIADRLNWPGQVFFYTRRGHIHVSLPHPDYERKCGVLDK